MHDELLLFKTFVIKQRQDRYINLIATDKGRKKLRSYIAHFEDIESKYSTPLHSLKTNQGLVDLLKSEGAPPICYIIAENSKYDMKSLPLTDAITQLFNSGMAFFLSCIPGKLAYYEGENSSKRLLLKL
jgi:hypothetical protein